MPLIKLDDTYKYCIPLLPMPFFEKNTRAIICLFFDLLLLFTLLWLLEQNYIHLTPIRTLRNSIAGTMSVFSFYNIQFLLTNSASAAVPLPAIEFRYYEPFSISSSTNLSFTCNWTILLSNDQTFSGN